MTRRNIYEGPASCYALREGIYVRGEGVNRYTAAAIIKLLLRDLARGWTYDHSCNRIPMTLELFVRRLRYLIPLAKKHYGEAEARVVKQLVEYVIKYGHLPPGWDAIAERYIAARKPVAVAVARARARAGA